MTQTDTILEISGLGVPLPSVGDRSHAITDVSLTLKRGEILCVVGESGSGKSISANTVMGLLPPGMSPDAGSVTFKGRSVLGLGEREMEALRGADISMIFQEPMSALNPTMKVGQQIMEVMEEHNRPADATARQKRMLELLGVVGLPDPESLQHVYPFRLSGGQRQRIVIAMALALEPSILIADEPTTALDVTTQAQILQLIRDIQASMGMAVLFITHDFGVVADIADRVAVMEKGRLVEMGTRDEVLDNPQHPYTRRLLAAVPHGRPRTDPVPKGAPILKVENLTKTYVTAGGFGRARRVVHAVQDVSFSLARGETLGIVGESGSGKSSIGKCLLKLQDIDGGRILFDGSDIAPLSPSAFRPMRRRIQMIFQDPFASLNPRHSIARILTEGPVAHGVPQSRAMDRARELMDLVQLDRSALERYPNEFSGGQRQRIGIARALALDPELIVADESVSALDVSVQAQVLELLDHIQRSTGVSMIFITHDLRVAAQICHNIGVMHQGRLVEYGPPAEILVNPSQEYTRRLIAAIPGRAQPH
ncbi:ABC transporter ATP-binding protein [Alloyangia pacifica]|uniref:Peptide/nickel transport system ATP-binding protein n=1 Tax=Alloyangia pacifica TaxID=311180 RepID=A0A1I6VH00_9RHOB|nr:ABC transporter ATP-binding protein [Alloyangia pacifica]SDH97909.1 peptide/nickel transport system ATP-binding protein [Alloyangia pacifica]SFT13036.1 peptide/nickel transport system ATP-binding protein [Alloyangia pacifica]